MSNISVSNYEEYIPVSERTRGNTTRGVFIHPAHAIKFVNLDDGAKNQIIKDLVSLSAKAGGISAFSNSENAFEHMHLFQKCRVAYKLLAPNRNYSHGVYITSFNLIEGVGKDSVGLKLVKRVGVGKDWSLRQNQQKLETEFAAVNGLCSDVESAAEEIMPRLVERVAAETRTNRDSLNKEGFTLFYNPQALYMDGKKWTTPEQKTTSKEQAAQLLATAILQAEQNPKKVSWTVHHNGAELFRDALRQLRGRKLKNHDAMLLSVPDSVNALEVLEAMSAAGVDMKADHQNDAIKYQAEDVTGLRNRTVRAGAIGDKLISMGLENAGETYKARRLSTAGAMFGVVGAFGRGILSAIFKQQTILNWIASATGIANPTVNPTFHPFKDNASFGVAAKKSQDGKKQIQHKIVFEELVKKVRQKFGG